MTLLPRTAVAVMVLLMALMIAACASRAPTPLVAADGPEQRPPPNLMAVPDALPKLEAIRDGGPNKPYAVLGESHVPLRADAEYQEAGIASWYGRAFHGRPTASGEIYNMYAMTAAHKTLPIPSYARVVNPANGRAVIVRVNDRGPFVKGRVIDLSYTAALKLDALARPTPVRVERITPEQIRAGAWRPPMVEGDDVPPAAGGEPSLPAREEMAAPLPMRGPTAVETTPPPTPTTATANPTAEPPGRAHTGAQRGWWLQLGAFRDRALALRLQQQAAERVQSLSLLLAVFNDQPLHRVQAGPFATRDEARQAAERVREQLAVTPIVVERR
jgi:rare lipoprotein A